MIYHDRIKIVTAGEIIGYDEYGEPIIGPPTWQTVAGNVFPLGSEEQLSAGFVSTRYRMVLHRSAVLPAAVVDDSVLRFGCGPYPIDAENPFDINSGLRLDGAPEVHTWRGRLHHYELITKSIQ